LKNKILSEKTDHQTIFLRGTSGRGKSSFVFYLVYCILLRNKVSKKRKADHESQPLVGLVRDEQGKLVLTPSGFRTVRSIPISVYYYISDVKADVHQTNLAQHFTMAVASDDFGKKEFNKRLSEAGRNSKTFVLTSPTREEMHLIFKDILTADEIMFRLDVVGCNPRALPTEPSGYAQDLSILSLTEDTCADILAVSKTDARFRWVSAVVLHAIAVARLEDNKITLNSLFYETFIEGEAWCKYYTSTFMSFLAGKIRDKARADTMIFLIDLFGRSGIGNCHEYDCHNFFCSVDSANHLCWKSTTNEWVRLALGGHREKVLFRNITDISAALSKSCAIRERYLMSTITNLALIDSIIPDDTVLQMTVSSSHRGASNRMEEIRNALGNPTVVHMVFVVPVDVIARFSFPSDLPPNVEMYVTVPKVMTMKEAKKLRSH